jgi:biotin transport system substrate-specific component
MQASAPAHGIPWTLGRLNKPLFDTLFPNATTGHRILASVVFIVLTFACAKARFYLPDNPTPITLQTFGVLLTGSVMGWRWGMAAMLGYIGLGALGLPMFIGSDALRTPAEAWNKSITGVTGGYIIGFVVAAGVSGYLSQLGFIRSSSLWAIALGGLLLYVPALIWLANIDFGWPAEGKLFVDGMYIYMPGDITKILATSLAVTVLWNHGHRIIDAVRRRARELLGRGSSLLTVLSNRGGRLVDIILGRFRKP